MTTILITSLCGLVVSAISSFVTWILSKKKYVSEVESTNIQNM
jgi:hypothetical protein